ncbi:kinesin-like protein KIF20B [Scomber japonicus]|uniref:kinesin-like protein KIF20B n=1 Tax=Scomber japonicus TaxID=13676 RepID=UPI0023069256|nr:kinesin-like protein KIF20B [Scomber japonicus]
MKENKALINGMFQLQTQVTELQKQLIEQTVRSDSLSEQLDTSKTRLQELESQSEEKTNIVKSLTQEVGHLRQEVKEGEGQSSSVFHASMEQLKKESEAALQRSAQTCQLMEELQREKSRLEETLTHSEKRCERLTEELANQKAEFSHQLQSLRAELESEGRALRGGLELESEGRALRGGLEERRGDLLEETLLQTKIVRQGKNLKEEEEENLQRKEQVDEERTVSVVEELKQELQRVQGRSRRSREFEAVKREMERLKETKTQSVLRSGGRVLNPEQDVPVSSLRSNMADRKRKSSEVQDLVFSENKRNRLRTNKQNQEQKDGTLQKIGDLIQNSPSRLRSKAKTIIGLVSGHPVGKETVTTATKETVTTATKETVTTATKLRQGRRKLFQGGVTTPLLDSPQMSAVAEEEKESDHLIIKRQLRSKTCRK